MTFKLRRLELFLFLLYLALGTLRLAGQAAAPGGELRGEVTDPSGAVVPAAQIALHLGHHSFTTKSGRDGVYSFPSLAPGSYTVTVSARGFAPLTLDDVVLSAGQTRELKLSLSIAVEHQEVTVKGENQGVSINSDQNSSATVIRGRDLDALSDDPDELQNQLQALAGPAAGPNGGQIYIDGFTGGQLPPKSSILEIRVNQNPFSAEFDRIGYGRIEIITKPGTQKLHGSISSFGNDSALNTANPLVRIQPTYDLYAYFGNLSGPLTSQSSYFFNFYRMMRQNQNIVNAVDPTNTSQKIDQAYANPSGLLVLTPRFDFQLGNRNTITIRDSYWRSAQTGGGVGALDLAAQASTILDQENTLQIGDTLLVNERLVSDLHFQWRRMRNQQTASSFTPTVIVQGAFTDGGSSSGVVQDHQDDFELQDKSTATAGRHTLRFGADMRIYRDANYSTSGENGTYLFSSISDYPAAPTQYSATVIHNSLVRAVVFDGSLYLQDDWKLTPNFVLGTGLRYEGQNWIQDHNDWAPRIALAWSPLHTGSAPAKTVLRAGYGWFYNRFTVPNSFSNFAGTPYITEVLHDNLINQQSYVIQSPGPYDPSNPGPPSGVTASTSIPSYHSIDPHFHAALDMQMGVGVDRQLSKRVVGNITYLYTQGVHQYLSNNVTAPAFDPATYTVTGGLPKLYNYQYQSGGVYKQSQVIASASATFRHLTATGNYSYNAAKSDTQGANFFVSDSQDPGLDYGRPSFATRHEGEIMGSYSAPYAITVAGAFFARSGVPYNLTIGSDLTENNQFNARPTYGTCGTTGAVTTQYVQTRYGCLDTNPVANGKGERMVPFGAGIGPSNSTAYLRVSKVFGIGPRMESATPNERSTVQASNSVSGRGLSGSGTAIHLDASAPRKYNLTLIVSGINAFNNVNYGTPNGVLSSPLFNQTQALADGQYGSPTAGNRTILLQSNFSF